MPTLPALALTATLAPPTPTLGGPLTATIAAANSGSALTGAVLTVTLPAGVVGAVTTTQGTWTLAGPTLTVTLGTLAGATTATITATIEASATGTASVAASLTADAGTAGPATATVTVAAMRPTIAGLGRLTGRPSAMAPGVYSLWKVGNGTDFSSLAAGIVGILFQTTWDTIETAQDVFDWSGVDAVIDAATAAGLHITLALGTGGMAQCPSYITDGSIGIPTVSIVNTSIYQGSAGTTFPVPVLWDATYLARKLNLIQLAGQRYAANPNVRAVQVNGAASNGTSGDWVWPSAQGNYTMPDSSVVALDQVAQWNAAGYTTAKALAAGQQVIAATANWFPSQMIKHPFANADPDLDVTPLLDAKALTLADELLTWAWGRYPNRFLAGWHRLKATTPAGDSATVTGATVDSTNYKYTLLANHPHQFIWQCAAQTSATDNSRQNGGTATDALSCLNGTFAAALAAYKPRWLELWNPDATHTADSYPVAIQAMTDTLRGIHAGN